MGYLFFSWLRIDTELFHRQPTTHTHTCKCTHTCTHLVSVVLFVTSFSPSGNFPCHIVLVKLLIFSDTAAEAVGMWDFSFFFFLKCFGRLSVFWNAFLFLCYNSFHSESWLQHLVLQTFDAQFWMNVKLKKRTNNKITVYIIKAQSEFMSVIFLH